MGDPKKLRKKYSPPMHPWNKTAIDAEKILTRNFGLRTKKEIYVASSFLKKYKNLAKKLIATKTAQAEKEKAQVLARLQRLGLLQAGSTLDSILDLKVENVLARRLQSVVFAKGLARSMKQARQFIVHRHIKIGEKSITAPSYLVTLEEETVLSFNSSSRLASEDHPERSNEAKEVKEELEAIKAQPTNEQVAEQKAAAKKEEQTPEIKEQKAEATE